MFDLDIAHIVGQPTMFDSGFTESMLATSLADIGARDLSFLSCLQVQGVLFDAMFLD